MTDRQVWELCNDLDRLLNAHILSESVPVHPAKLELLILATRRRLRVEIPLSELP